MNNIVMVTGSKGGVGKSTTTINIGAALQAYGQRVVIADLDRMNRTLMQYPDLYLAASGLDQEQDTEVAIPLPAIYQPSPTFTASDLVASAESADILLVDMPAGYPRDSQKVISVAGLVIVPTTLGTKDFFPAIETARNAVHYALEHGGQPAVRMLLNKIEPKRAAVESKLEMLATLDLPAPLMTTMIPMRQGLDTAGEQGRTAFSYHATRDIRVLYRELAKEIMQMMGLHARED